MYRPHHNARFDRFYNGKAWAQTRVAYIKAVGGMCEECAKRGEIRPGKIVHHITRLNERNITDTNVTLSFGNLELVCQDCHNAIHFGDNLRYCFDDDGNISPR